jgi:hypothetical protein
MNWNAQIGRDLKALDGIAAILLALAALAERAAGAPLPVRWLVLWFLRQAEGVATEFVAGSPGVALGAGASDPTASPHGCRPSDAIDLAFSLSSLACAVAILAAQLRRQAFLHSRPRSLRGCVYRHILCLPDAAHGMAASPTGRIDSS